MTDERTFEFKLDVEDIEMAAEDLMRGFPTAKVGETLSPAECDRFMSMGYRRIASYLFVLHYQVGFDKGTEERTLLNINKQVRQLAEESGT